MAEAVGLVLGGIALTGTFKDCIDLLSYISAGRTFGRDSRILLTKLDIEKTLLLQWGSKMGIGSTNVDPRLEDVSVHPVVHDVLQCIRLLLSDSSKLKERYGLDESNDSVREPRGTLISEARSELFQRQYDNFKSDIRSSQFRTKTLAKFKWVVRDMEKFQKLVDDISHFNTKLRELLPIANTEWRLLSEWDVATVSRNPRTLEILRSATLLDQSGHQPLVEAIQRKSLEERVLQCLWFPSMQDRQHAITNPHTHTFDWVYDLPSLPAVRANLRGWLESDHGIYWISGKAGSGKSTLMRFVYEHSETETSLRAWAGRSSLTTASFFFWHLGGQDQKSQEGLMRKLLHDMLVKNGEYIPLLLPTLWRAADQVRSDAWSPINPSRTQLQLAFSKFDDIIQPSTKFCFFIDGLDEYGGDCEDGAAFVQSLMKSPYVKVVVSSRPVPPCFAAFHGYPSLRVHELTQADIRRYVNETIATHFAMQDVLNANPEAAMGLVSDVVDKADGVFLWVVLACRSLLQGFVSHDGVTDLARRIDDLPPELEGLFQHMLSKIAPRYRIPAAKILRICTQSQLVPGTKPLSTIALAAAMFESEDGNASIRMKAAPWLRKASTCLDVEAWLRSRCWGLVEVQRMVRNDDASSVLDFDFCACTSPPDDPVYCQVNFLHRTVLEFLNRPGAWDHDYLDVPDEDFEANTMLARAALHLAKETPPPCTAKTEFQINRIYESISTHVKDVFRYLRKADDSAKEIIISTIENFHLFLLEVRADASRKVMHYDNGNPIIPLQRAVISIRCLFYFMPSSGCTSHPI